MIKVTILKDNVQTHGATFPTLEEANTWLSQGAEGKWWGEPAWTEVVPQVVEQQEVIITPAELDEEGNVITEAVTEMQEIVISPETTIEHEAEYSVVVEDVSEQIAKEQALARRKEKRAFGESMIDQISLVNETASVNEATLEALVLDPDFMVIREHLYSGSLLSAYNKVLSSETKILTVFSQDALADLKAKLQAKLQELGEL